MAKQVKTIPGQVGFQALCVASEPREFVGDDGIKRTFQQFDFYGGCIRLLNPPQMFPVGSFVRLSGLVACRAGTMVKLVPTVFEPVENLDVDEFSRGPVWACQAFATKEVYTRNNTDYLSLRLRIIGGLIEIRQVPSQLFRLVNDNQRYEFSGVIVPVSRYDTKENNFDLVYTLAVVRADSIDRT